MRVAILAGTRWSAFAGNTHWLARAYAELGHSVLFVDPPVSPLSLVRQPDRLDDLKRRKPLRPKRNLTVWTPLVIPGQHAAVPGMLNAARLARGIKRLLGEPDLVIASSLAARRVVGTLGGRRVYYCIDSFEDLPGVNAELTRRRERHMLRSVDFAVACSIPVAEQLKSRADRVIYVPQGVDPAFLVSSGDSSAPHAVSGLRRPLVGYVGNLNFRIDADLLRAAGEATDGTLVMIGGRFRSAGPSTGSGVEEVLGRPNVALVGHRPVEELPRYLSELDVAIVPYAATPFNRKSFPVKIPQYLAAGLPVVSSENGATDEYRKLVYVADSPDAFADAVRRALSEDTEALRCQRRTTVEKRTWTIAAQEIVAAADLE